MKSHHKSINLKTLKIFWQFTKPYPFMFWYGTIGSIFATVVSDIIPPLIIATAFNHMQKLVATGQPIVLGTLINYVLLYLAAMVFSITLWRTQAYCTWKYSILAMRDLYLHLFNHLQSMGSKFHADRFGGALVSQVNKFVGAYERMTADFTWNIITIITAYFSSLIVLLLISPIYAAALSVVSITYIVVIYFRMRIQAPFNRRLASSESEQTAKLADNITNISSVRAFAGELHESELFKAQAQSTTNKHLELMSVQMKNELISQSGTSFLNFMAFALGVIAITRFHASVGSLYLIIMYTIGLTNRLWMTMFVVRNINRSFGDAAEMTEILQLTPEIKDPINPLPLTIHKGSIEFKDVGFEYLEREKNTPVFKNLNISIGNGEKIGLVGHSGGGKSTITKLLLRFADIQAGTILIDKIDIAKIKQADLRKAITYVPQEPLLFHRSLTDNIGYGKFGASQQEIIKAAKMAHAHDFIEKLPHGYDTLVGERGVKLSGGQRQRIAIARAMLKDAPVLVLDEATSSLDSESEALIQDALWKLMEGRTAIVIAHRLSTIQKMDRILVLEEGKIVEEGSHKELLANNGVYAGLWKHQSGGFIEE